MTNKKKAFLLVSLFFVLLILFAVVFASFSAEAPSGFIMEYGAEARIDGNNSLRFSASLNKAQVDKWKNEYTVEAGMLIAPYYYINLYGGLSAENVFGENAIYSADNGEKPNVLNIEIPFEDFILSKNKSKYILCGSVCEITEKEYSLTYTARAYIKLSNSKEEIYFSADYNNFDILNSTRSYYDVVKSANDRHNSTGNSLYTKPVENKLSEIINSEELPILNIAVHKKYEASGMTGETGASPLSWMGNNESDRVNIFAWYDFKNLNREITAKELNIKYVTTVSELDKNTKYIILGSELAEEAGLTTEGITADNGHKIVNRNGNIYLYGKNGYGTVNAVYAFLKQAYGIEFFTDTVYTLEDGFYSPSEIRDETFNPSVDYQWAHDGLLFRDDGSTVNYQYQLRLGYTNYWQITGGSFHAIESVFPKAQYPSYYYNGDVIDFNAAGAINTQNAMVKAVADWLYQGIMQKDQYGRISNKTVYFFGPADERKWSKSSASSANLAKYGANSGEYILFMNAVTELLNTDAKYADIRAVEISMLAYNEALKAPTVNLSELEINKVTDRGVRLTVMFAPIEMNMNDAPSSTVKDFYGGNPEYYYGEYQKWIDFAGEENLYFWRYSAGFKDFFVPMNTVQYIQENYKAIVGEDGYIKHMMDQGTNKSPVQTNFQALMVYLKGKLGKNVNEDLDTLIDNFMNAYYGKQAGQYMKQLLSAEQEHLNTVKTKSQSITGSLYWIFGGKGADISGCHYFPTDNIYNSKVWSKNCADDGGKMLMQWYSYIESALAAGNKEQQDRIKAEAIAIRYISLKAHGKPLISGDTLGKVNSDALSLGITRSAEGQPIT